MPRWARLAPVRAVRRLVMDFAVLPAFRIPFRVRARYPGTRSEWTRTGWAEPFIVAANHTSNLDPVFLLLALPPRLRGRVSPAMGLNRFHAWFTRFSTAKSPHQKCVARVLTPALHRVAYVLVTLLFQTFPFPQGTAYRSSLEYTGELLDRGVSILIFPEGEVNRAGGAGKTTGAFKTGVAKIADLTDAAVVPAGIRWERARERGFPRLRPRITVSFGRPIEYRGEGYEEFTSTLQSGVRGLIR
jgi:long-chain acyl-CoA synthetase